MKNMIGSFWQPRLVWLDIDTLRTLPRREFLSGMAEVIKYGVIWDDKFFLFLEQERDYVLGLEREAVTHVIRRSCEVKAEVVSRDERESGLRAILNFGHTIGHALESLGGYRSLIHGEAVGIGLVLEADLARHQGYCDSGTVDRIRSLVLAAGLSDCPTSRSSGKVWTAMQHDKKVSQGKVVGVWPESIGQVWIAPLEKTTFTQWFESVADGASRRSSRTGKR